MINNVHFSSATNEWSTPQWLFDELDNEFHFTTDVCSNGNAKVEHCYTQETDGLSQEWQGVCWMNPPYGREIKDWLRKAWESSLQGTIVVCLIPARTDTKYWHDYVVKASEIRFLKGRLKFGTATSSAPFPSCIVVFNEDRGYQSVRWVSYAAKALLCPPALPSATR